MVPFMFLQDSLNVMLKGRMYNVRKTDPKFEEVKDAIRADDPEDYILKLLDKKETLLSGGKGKIVVTNGEVFFNSRPCVGPIVDRILYMIDEDIDVTHIERFLINLEENPSSRSVNELYSFLEKCNLPITEDGYFLAYKKVGLDWLDLHSQTIDNHPGKIVSMPRNSVDDNFNNGCSTGLHVASREYYVNSRYGAGEFNKLIVVKVNPKDVVSVPLDCNFTKMRVCEYEVIEEVEDTDTIKESFIETNEYTEQVEKDDWTEVPEADSYIDHVERKETPELSYEKDVVYNEDVCDAVMEYVNEKTENIVNDEDLISDHFGVLKKFNILRHLAKVYDIDYSVLRDKRYNTFIDIIEAISEEIG